MPEKEGGAKNAGGKKAKELAKELKDFCRIFTKIGIVKGIFFYGSATKKYVSVHDIDICVIIDDTKKDYEKEIPKVKLLMAFAEKNAGKKGFKLHFQPPKPISLIWHIIRIAEPWIISTIRTGIIIYDPSGFLRTIKNLLKSGKIYAVDEKAERLFSRAMDSLMSVRRKLLGIPLEMLDIITIISQMLLNYVHVYTTSANETRDMMRKNQEEIGISPAYIEFYDELIKANEKIYRGTLGEFNGDEIDIWEKRVRGMIEESKLLLARLKQKQEKARLLESYAYAISLCKSALHEKESKESEEHVLKQFKQRFVETNKIPHEYYDAMKELYEYVRKNKKKKGMEYINKLYFKGMEVMLSQSGK